MANTSINITNDINNMALLNKSSYYKLRRWYEEIKDYDQLCLEEAKDLHRLMHESDDVTREKYREKLILGTLYLVFHFVCVSGLTGIKSSYYDTDDIIAASSEVWINMLDSPNTLNNNVKHFIQLLQSEFYIRVTKQLEDKKNLDSNCCTWSSKIRANIFGNILKKYLECIKSGLIYDEQSCYEFIVKGLKETGLLSKFNDSEVYQIYLFFNNLKNLLDIEDISRISATDLATLKDFLIDSYTVCRNAGVIKKGDFTNDVDNNLLAKQISKIIFEGGILKEREIDVLNRSFGLSVTRQTDIEIGANIGRTDTRVWQIRQTAIRKLKRTPLLEKK